MARPAVFLDRDGTLNVEKQYLHRIADWEWIEGAVEAIKRINQMGYLAIVVTNQAGVARGYYTEQDVMTLHRYVDAELAKSGAKIDAYYYCPHHVEYGEVRDCNCRKPKPGMLLAAKRDFDIDLSKSFLIGDKAIDIIAAQAVAVQPVLVRTGYGIAEQKFVDANVSVADSILVAINEINYKSTNIHSREANVI